MVSAWKTYAHVSLSLSHMHTRTQTHTHTNSFFKSEMFQFLTKPTVGNKAWVALKYHCFLEPILILIKQKLFCVNYTPSNPEKVGLILVVLYFLTKNITIWVNRWGMGSQNGHSMQTAPVVPPVEIATSYIHLKAFLKKLRKYLACPMRSLRVLGLSR